jgi:ParB family chromosome partitioning protein
MPDKARSRRSRKHFRESSPELYRRPRLSARLASLAAEVADTDDVSVLAFIRMRAETIARIPRISAVHKSEATGIAARAEQRLREMREGPGKATGEDETPISGAANGAADTRNAGEVGPEIEQDNHRHSREGIGDVPVFQMHSIADIRVGERYRRELGDIDALAASIKDVGLLHPIVIAVDGALVAGQRRVAACKLLGWTHVPVTVVYLDGENVRGEFAENAVRKDFTLSEAVAIKRALEPIERAKAKERQAAAGPISGRGAKPTGGAKLAQAVNGKTRDRLGALTGIKRTTLAKAEAIVEAAEAEPAKFGSLVEAMDRTGRVNGPYRRMRNVIASDEIKKEPPGLPMYGPYRTGIIDTPWASEPGEPDKDHGARGYYPYPTMTPEQMSAALAVPSILHADASVWLWITNFHLLRGDHLIIAKAWDLKPVALFTWIKGKFGQGQRARGATEHLIQMVRGSVLCLGSDTKTWFEGAGGEHSQKPIEAYELVEKLTPAPRYFEMFSRGPARDKWDLHGNEVGKHAAPPVKQDDAEKFSAPARSPITFFPVNDVKPDSGGAEKAPPKAAPSDTLDIPNFLKIGHPDCSWRNP